MRCTTFWLLVEIYSLGAFWELRTRRKLFFGSVESKAKTYRALGRGHGLAKAQ